MSKMSNNKKELEKIAQMLAALRKASNSGQSGKSTNPSSSSAKKKKGNKKKKETTAQVVKAELVELKEGMSKNVPSVTVVRSAPRYTTRLAGIPTYGPPMAVDHDFRTGIVQSYVYKVQSYWLGNIIAAMISFGAALMPDQGLSNVNYAYVWVFLMQYAQSWVNGQSPVQNLDVAPHVFWDILHALRPKRRGNVFFSTVNDGATVQAPTTANMLNCPFGTTGTITSGYGTINTDISAYTAALGYVSTINLFEAAGKSMDCVSIDNYKCPWPNDETSIFSYFEVHADSISAAFGKYVGGDGTAHIPYGTVKLLGTRSCEWLMRLGLPPVPNDSNATHPYSSGYGLDVVASPGAMVVHRMLNRLRGYAEHQSYPVLKSVSITSFQKLFDQLYNQICLVAGSTPCVSSGVGQYDFKAVSYAVVAQYFRHWQSVAAGCTMAIGSTDKFAYCGSWQLPVSLGTFMAPNVMHKNCSFLYPYKRGHATYYPCLYIDSDFAVTTTANYASGGTFAANWNQLTNLVGTAEAAVFNSGTSFSALLPGWAGVVQVCGPYLPFSTPIDEQPLNLASVTRITNSAGGVLGLLCKNLPDHVRSYIDGNMTANWYAATNASRNVLGSVFGEHQMIASVQNSLTQYSIVESAWVALVHPIAGFGNNIGSESSNESAPNEEREKSKQSQEQPKASRKEQKTAPPQPAEDDFLDDFYMMRKYPGFLEWKAESEQRSPAKGRRGGKDEF